MTKRTAYTVSIATLFMSACATHPIPDDVTRDSTLNIVKKIRCEARKAIEEHDPKRVFDAIEIAYNFKFTITENNNAGGSAIFSLPFTNGTFTLGIGAGEDRQRSGERNLLMAETFKDLRGEDCRVQADRENWKYPITGTVGLKETIGTFVGLLQRAGSGFLHRALSRISA